MRQFLLRPALPLAFCLWLGLVAWGSGWLIHYSFAAGEGGRAPATLPPAFVSRTSPPRPLLLLPLHPRCPCSRATLHELARVLTRASNSCDVTVLMYRPGEQPDGWMEGSLLEECQRMHLQVRPDPDGRVAASMGVFTSGGVLLYDRSRRLRYQGGITGARGHEGDNEGEDALVQNLDGTGRSRTSMPVFGCPLGGQSTNRAAL